MNPQSSAAASDSPRILVIRRDNIGDLVCTTPLLRALRRHFPRAHLGVLVNSYNRDVVDKNPDIDAVYAYTKAKHRPAGMSRWRVYWERLQLMQTLRRARFDYVILAGAHFLSRALRLARFVRPTHIIGFTEPGRRLARHIDIGLPYTLPRPLHEVEDIFRLLEPLGITGEPPLMRVVPDPDEMGKVERLIRTQGWRAGTKIIGVHISARKPSNRWPVRNFSTVMKNLHVQQHAAFLLFWSPGSSGNPLHPGDDEKSREIIQALAGQVPLLGYPTHRLGELIAGLAQCDYVICSDGGALHLAAALGKPIVCFFGKSDASRWRPWGVPHVLLQPPSQDVKDITVEMAEAAFQGLLQKGPVPRGDTSAPD